MWTSEPPTGPGRFWWRIDSVVQPTYGLMLVQWISYNMIDSPL